MQDDKTKASGQETLKLKSLWISLDRKKEAGGVWENYRSLTTLIAM